MNAVHVKILRDSYMAKSVTGNSTQAEYMRFITDCNLEFVTSKDFVVADDTNGIVHCICLNEDMVTQADYPVKVISAAYEDIHAIEAVMSQANFEEFLKSGFLNNVEGFSNVKRELLMKWSRDIKIQAQQATRATPYYTQEPTIVPMGTNTIIRDDGVTTIRSPASLSPNVNNKGDNESNT